MGAALLDPESKTNQNKKGKQTARFSKARVRSSVEMFNLVLNKAKPKTAKHLQAFTTIP